MNPLYEVTDKQKEMIFKFCEVLKSTGLDNAMFELWDKSISLKFVVCESIGSEFELIVILDDKKRDIYKIVDNKLIYRHTE